MLSSVRADSLLRTHTHTRARAYTRTHALRQGEWNPPEGSFGTALLNLFPAGRRSVGSEREPVGAASRFPSRLVFLALSCLLTLVHFFPSRPAPPPAASRPLPPTRVVLAGSTVLSSPPLPFHTATTHLLLLSAAAQRTAPADFIHRFINLSSVGVSPLLPPPIPHPLPPPPSVPPPRASVGLFSLRCPPLRFLSVPHIRSVLKREREREGGSERWRSEINTWTRRRARISIEMEVWSHSPGSDEQLSSPRRRSVSRSECVWMWMSFTFAYMFQVY